MFAGTHPYVTEVCNQLLTSNGTNVRVDTRIRDITHPCYCVIYDDYLQDLEIKISSHSANDSWNDWFRLSSSDWDSLNYSIPHFYIEPHAPAARFVTYKNNMEVSTMLVSDMQFLSANSRVCKRGTYIYMYNIYIVLNHNYIMVKLNICSLFYTCMQLYV